MIDYFVIDCTKVYKNKLSTNFLVYFLQKTRIKQCSLILWCISTDVRMFIISFLEPFYSGYLTYYL